MKRLAAWVAGVVLLPACCTGIQHGNIADPSRGLTLVEQLEAETPALVWWKDEENHHTYDSDNVPPGYQLMPYCGSVWVSYDTMLTAEHCVDDIGRPEQPDDDNDESPITALEHIVKTARELAVWTPLGQQVLYSNREDIDTGHKVYHSAKVIAVDKVNDLALVRADAPGNHMVAHLRRGVVHDGEELHIIGNPAGRWWTYIHGYVAADRPEYWDGSTHRHILQVTAPIFFGNSGGGAYDVEGNLVGIADALDKVPDVAFFVPKDVVRSFLDRNGVTLSATR